MLCSKRAPSFASEQGGIRPHGVEQAFMPAVTPIKKTALAAEVPDPGYFEMQNAPSYIDTPPPSRARNRFTGFSQMRRRPGAQRQRRNKPNSVPHSVSPNQRKRAGECFASPQVFWIPSAFALGCNGERTVRNCYCIIADLAGCVLERGNDRICSRLAADGCRAVLGCGNVLTVLHS